MAVLVYLKLFIKVEANSRFEQDLAELDRLARQQPGFTWSEILRPVSQGDEWVILSEWESREHSRAWEHSPRHEEIMRAWAGHYARPYLKRRFSTA
ncbi:MAG: antibiotic biosynthesis monooxygenase [Chloroflexi bacterium]|nr:antibiotic biosynthesis monooxygenase [Chloroflexota bacterium]